MTRLAEQHRMAAPWVLDMLEEYARYPMMQKRVTPEGCLGLFRRQVYLDVALRGKEVTCYETVEGLEVRGPRTLINSLEPCSATLACFLGDTEMSTPSTGERTGTVTHSQNPSPCIYGLSGSQCLSN